MVATDSEKQYRVKLNYLISVIEDRLAIHSLKIGFRRKIINFWPSPAPTSKLPFSSLWRLLLQRRLTLIRNFNAHSCHTSKLMKRRFMILRSPNFQFGVEKTKGARLCLTRYRPRNFIIWQEIKSRKRSHVVETSFTRFTSEESGVHIRWILICFVDFENYSVSWREFDAKVLSSWIWEKATFYFNVRSCEPKGHILVILQKCLNFMALELSSQA